MTMPAQINAWEGDTCEFGYRNGSWTDQSMDDTVVYVRFDLARNWRPIETAPKDGTWILVCGIDADGPYVRTARYVVTEDSAMFMNGSQTVGHNFLTHWQPLPAPPVWGEST